MWNRHYAKLSTDMNPWNCSALVFYSTSRADIFGDVQGKMEQLSYSLRWKAQAREDCMSEAAHWVKV